MLNPVIQARPLMAGMIAGRSPIDVPETIRPWNREPMMRFVDHRIADGHLAARMKNSHSCTCARARGAPVGSARRDDARIARDLADSFERTVELDNGDASNFWVFRMDDAELLASGEPDFLACHRQLACLGSFNIESKLRRVHDRVEHPSVCDIDSDRAQPRHLDRRIQPIHEARDVLELDRSARPS